MRLALYQGVDHIERFGQGRKAEKPPAAGEKVILIALIFIEILRKKQGTQEIVHRCVHANEEIEAIGPVLDLAQPKLPPPERNHVQERPGDPAQVYRPDPVATGVLDQCRDAADQTRDAEPEDQGDQHAHVKIEIEIGRQGRRTLSHQVPALTHHPARHLQQASRDDSGDGLKDCALAARQDEIDTFRPRARCLA